jgi:hypothetical protein
LAIPEARHRHPRLFVTGDEMATENVNENNPITTVITCTTGKFVRRALEQFPLALNQPPSWPGLSRP